MNIELDRIYNMDCLEGMKAIPDGSVDAVICDLPYGTTANKWDSVIPFDKLWEQYRRICKPNAAIVLFGQEPFSSALRMSNIEWFRYDWIWQKSRVTGFLDANRKPMRSHETISVFYDHLPTYNPQMRTGFPKHKRSHPCSNKSGNIYGKSSGQVYSDEETTEKFPLSVIEFNNEHNVGAKGTWHPTQKPVDLLRYLVLTYTNEGDTVLDNCMGSGTTAIACIKERRHFIGFELNKEYFDKACKRIDTEQRQLTLF